MAGIEDQLMAVSPLDGRYANQTAELAPYCSEYGLIRARVAVEAGWLSTLASGVLPDVEPLGGNAQAHLDRIAVGFSVSDAARVKELEATTKHDVKAVELWLRERLATDDGNTFADYLELIHFGCTSEDVNNLAIGTVLHDAWRRSVAPNRQRISTALDAKAIEYADMPLLSQTHGQPATPTTLGKEMRVFGDRLHRHMEAVGKISIYGKFNGASGTYAAADIAYPEVNWPQVNRKFVERFGFEYAGATTQIESHDWMARYFNEISLGNTVMTDLARDMWAYISRGVFRQQVVAGEVGSSTMPHKINPIDFENAEANFGLANATLLHLAGKLPISRLQRDLSDSSAQRAIGEGLGHTLLAQKSLIRGLGKVSPDESAMSDELEGEYSLLGEAVQTVLRRYKVPGGYDMLKEATRGKPLNEDSYIALVMSLDIPSDAKDRLLDLVPHTYVGLAPKIARAEI